MAISFDQLGGTAAGLAAQADLTPRVISLLTS